MITKRRLSSDDEQIVRTKLAELELDFWIRRLLIDQGKRELEAAVGFTVPRAALKRIRPDVCKWWKVAGRRSPRVENLLTEKQWDRLRKAVAASAVDIQGRSINEAVAIVSVKFRCNAELLCGLTKELHFWNEETN